MKIRALESFSGAFSMYKGEVTECSDEAILQDLIKAKYIEEVNTEKSETEGSDNVIPQDLNQAENTDEVKTEKSKKSVKSNESK